jgi:hypothetical protein
MVRGDTNHGGGMVEDDEVLFNPNEIPVWRNTLCDLLLYKDNDKKFPNPYSFSMRNSWSDFIFPILFLPCLIYLIYLKKFKK